MKIKIIAIICLLAFPFIDVFAQTPQALVLDGNHLAAIKRKALQKDFYVLSLIDSLEKKANAFLKMKPVSVMDKLVTPVSGNKHDYMSQAPYFWYDSTKPNGLPYMRRDGMRNPEIYKITDRTNIGNLETASRTLALAWYFTGKEQYAAQAAILLRHWFLNKDTRMNPHLDYGQGIPGINTGRGIGIIESRTLMGIADAALLIQGSDSWTATDHKSLQQWYASFLDWMLKSKNGKEEHAAKNNHGTWYYAQVIDFALFTGNTAKAKQLTEESKARLDSQLMADGSQPLELDRTNGLGYSTMNLQGWFDVATLAEKVNVDLWNFRTSKGAGINTALDWLAPFATGEKAWSYQQIGSYNKNDIYQLLLRALNKYPNNRYAAFASRLDDEVNQPMTDLLYKK